MTDASHSTITMSIRDHLCTFSSRFFWRRRSQKPIKKTSSHTSLEWAHSWNFQWKTKLYSPHRKSADWCAALTAIQSSRQIGWQGNFEIIRPLTANLRWRPFSSLPHLSDCLELHNNNRASWILNPGPSESDVYSDVVQEARWNDLLHTARLLIRLDTPLHGDNARGAKYAVYYASVATHTVFENIKIAALRAMSEEKSCSPFPCFFIPWNHAYRFNKLIASLKEPS